MEVMITWPVKFSGAAIDKNILFSMSQVFFKKIVLIYV